MRIWIVLLFCVFQVWCDSSSEVKKIQLQSFVISSDLTANWTADYTCNNLTSVDFCGVTGLATDCQGGLFENTTRLMTVFIQDPKGTVKSGCDNKWSIKFTISATTIVLNGTVTPYYNNSIEQSSSTSSIVDGELNTIVRSTSFIESSKKTTNTAAVVVAVLEGLILLAIIIVVSYKVCFAKNKMNNFSGGGGGSASYSANPYGSSGTGVSYGAGPANGSFYDGAAAAYRRDNNSAGNTTTMRNEGYGYDQSLPRPEERTNQTAQNQNRVQTESPSLVPVPLGGSDPLNQWGDQRRPDPFA